MFTLLKILDFYLVSVTAVKIRTKGPSKIRNPEGLEIVTSTFDELNRIIKSIRLNVINLEKKPNSHYFRGEICKMKIYYSSIENRNH